MKILGIETSCDETAASIVADGTRILSNKIASQVDIHARYGGVVPEVASRQHMLAIISIIEQAMKEAGASWQDLDAVAVTKGPGLAGSLIVGVNTAKAISLAHKLPLIGVNHLEGHIYANWLTGGNICPPAVCVLRSWTLFPYAAVFRGDSKRFWSCCISSDTMSRSSSHALAEFREAAFTPSRK